MIFGIKEKWPIINFSEYAKKTEPIIKYANRHKKEDQSQFSMQMRGHTEHSKLTGDFQT